MCTKNSQLNKLCPFSVIENEIKIKMKTKCLLQLRNEHGNQVPQLNGFVSFSIQLDSIRFVCRLIVHLLFNARFKISNLNVVHTKLKAFNKRFELVDDAMDMNQRRTSMHVWNLVAN